MAGTRDGDLDWDWEDIHRRCLQEARGWRRRHEEVEDLAQDAVARAWRSRATCREAGPPTAWLRTIVRNEAHRAHARRPEGTVEVDLDAEAGLGDDVAERFAERAQVRVDVLRALGALSPAQRRLLVLRYGHDLKQPEVALALGVPEGTAKVMLHRARKQLRTRLSSYEPEGGAT